MLPSWDPTISGVLRPSELDLRAVSTSRRIGPHFVVLRLIDSRTAILLTEAGRESISLSATHGLYRVGVMSPNPTNESVGCAEVSACDRRRGLPPNAKTAASASCGPE